MFLTSIYLIAAVIGCTILLCQFVLALMGMGHDGIDAGHDAGDGFDVHHAGGGHGDADHPDSTHLFAIVSFKTLVAAAAFFGITGLATSSADFPATTTLVMSLAAGAVAMYGMYGMLRLIASLSSSGNERIDNAVGLPATVYIPIPAAGKGAGKVQLSMQNRIVEYQAVTDDAESLRTGEAVEVVEIRNSDTLKVRRVPQTV